MIKSGIASLLIGCVLVSFPQSQAIADDYSDYVFTPRSGLYVAGTLGFTTDYDIRSNELTASSNEAVFELDSGMAYTGAIGGYLGQARIEFEVGWRDPEVEAFTPDALGFSTDGELEFLTFMGNIFYDIPTGAPGLDIYLGAGAGLAWISGDFEFTPPVTVTNLGPGPDATTDKFDSNFSTFAYQFMAGLSLDVTDDLTFYSGYRFRGFTEVTDDGSLLVFREHDVHAIELGLRLDF
ncbi:MAG: outer membrane beta-barrel protein [Planctomycetota bacterium]